ncbi:MAG: helix-turn-helix domain-containing protein [Candidatus Aenigmatarchaeota archaeon]
MNLTEWLHKKGYKTVKHVGIGGKISDLIAYNDKEVVAFEEKKSADEIQTAIGQCLHYLEEANKVFIVLPLEENKKIPGKTFEVLKKHGIGLLFKGKDISKVIDAKYFDNSKDEILEKIKNKEERLKEKPKRSVRFSGISEKDILKLLEKHSEGMKILDIAKSLNIPRQTVSKYVYALVARGLIEQREVGRAKVCFLKRGKK